MKHLFSLLTFIVIFTHNISAQYKYFDFDAIFNSEKYLYFKQDTSISNRNWQIGKVNKSIFAYDSVFKRGLCTDTLNLIQAGDTFSAIVLFDTWGFAGGGNWFHLIFDYKLDADSGDAALVEMSLDQGKSWINLLDQDTVYNIRWWGNQDKPVLSGQQNQWLNFDANMTEWAAESDSSVYPQILRGKDSIFYRFTFIAGPSTQQREGWLIDNLIFINYFESINSSDANNAGFSLSPNPALNHLYIRSEKHAPIEQWRMYNLFGELVLSGESEYDISVSGLASGLYVMRIFSEGQWYSLKAEIATP